MIVNVKYINRTVKFELSTHDDFSTFYEVFVENNYAKLLKNATKDDIVVDAGANIGVFTTLASTRVKTVIAIEPDAVNFQKLQRNIDLNKLENVIAVNKALYHKSGLTLSMKNDGIVAKIDENGNKLVETTTLDDITEALRLQPTKLKMDIEGSEKYAVFGMNNSLKSINMIEAEIHSQEDFDAFIQVCKSFSIVKRDVESLKPVYLYALKHPFKILRLESFNHFVTFKRIVKYKNNEHSKADDYPILISAEKINQISHTPQ